MKEDPNTALDTTNPYDTSDTACVTSEKTIPKLFVCVVWRRHHNIPGVAITFGAAVAVAV